MSNIGPWLGASFTHMKENWQGHMVPSLIVFGVSFFGSIVLMTLLGVFVTVLAVGLGAISEDLGGLGAMLGLGIGTPVLLIGLIAVMTPLLIGYNRICLRMMRNEPYEISEIFATDGVMAAVVANLIAGVATSIAAMFCYFPALIVGVLFMFSTPLIADRKATSGMDAIRQSVALARQDLMGLMLYWFAAIFIAMAVAYIPLVGAMLTMPLITTFILTAYISLSDEGEQPHKALDGAPELVERDLANPYTSPRQV
jgi:hypothetical protein